MQMAPRPVPLEFATPQLCSFVPTWTVPTWATSLEGRASASRRLNGSHRGPTLVLSARRLFPVVGGKYEREPGAEADPVTPGSRRDRAGHGNRSFHRSDAHARRHRYAR